jgi:hypothetical protein
LWSSIAASSRPPTSAGGAVFTARRGLLSTSGARCPAGRARRTSPARPCGRRGHRDGPRHLRAAQPIDRDGVAARQA